MAVQHGSDTARFRVRCTYQELPEPILGPPSAARMPGRTLQGVIATSLPAQSSTWHAERAGFVDGRRGPRIGAKTPSLRHTVCNPTTSVCCCLLLPILMQHALAHPFVRQQPPRTLSKPPDTHTSPTSLVKWRLASSLLVEPLPNRNGAMFLPSCHHCELQVLTF